MQNSADNPAPVPTPQTAPDPKNPMALKVILGLVIGVAVIGVGGALFASSSPQKANIAGVSANSDLSDTELATKLDQQFASYKITVQGEQESKTFDTADAGLAFDSTATINDFKSRQTRSNFWQRMQWWKNPSMNLTLKVNEAKLKKFIDKHVTHTTVKARDAKLSIKNGKAHVTPEKAGEAYTLENATQAVKDHVAGQSTSPIVLTKQILQPDITTANIEPSKEKVTKILARKVTFAIESYKFRPNASEIAKWIEISPVDYLHTVDITINSGKVLEYLNRVAGPYVQPAKSQVVLKEDGGGTTVLVPGTSGRDITNKDKLAVQVDKALMSDKDITIDAAINYDAFKTVSAKSYPKWFVVDTTTKRMYAYAKTKLVRTFLISAGAPETPTKTGFHRIYSKVRIQDMRGNNVDGSRYFVPNVEWVNYFYGGMAIHGNWWRLGDFGRINASHGCVGITNAEGKWIYEWAPIGTPVIVHT